MIITTEIYKQVTKSCFKVLKGNYSKQHAEDLVQDVIIKLLKYEKPIDNLNAFIYTVATYTHWVAYNRDKPRLSAFQEIFDTASDTTYLDTSALIKKDYSTLLDYFQDNPVAKRVLEILIDNPEETHAELAFTYGYNKDTFKSNVRHMRNHLKGVTI